ncbi:putative Glucose 1-dehydrogenase [Hibiscus syriacus]|uniref:RecQ-mediated genome instability protein 1 n=1 Tax=Hibiscus syriacus TaxID=106335 RepID=A0A6A2ZSK8_HIBSY|nr:putative Glucose 1-dehydrogenase [Hibiscus syriacus]
MGLKLRREWLDSCIQGLESSVPRFSALDVSAKAKLCFQQFLLSDMNCSGGGILPENVDSMHLADLKGPFVLQVDEIVNISCPLKERYQDTPSGIKRCLKLSITDGVQRIFGMEYRPIKDLQVLAPAGLKVEGLNFNIRPVELCHLTREESLGMWTTSPWVVTPLTGLPSVMHVRRGLLMLVPESLEILGGVVEDLVAARQRLVAEVNKPPRGERTKTGVVPPLATRATLAAWPLNGVNFVEPTNNLIYQNSAPFWTDEREKEMTGRLDLCTLKSLECFLSARSLTMAGSTITTQRTVEDPTTRTRVVNAVPNSSSDVAEDVERMHFDSVPISRENAMSNSNSNIAPDNENIHVVEHSFMLSGDQEVPFTYLASLSARWTDIKDKATHVQGKIKCFLTGVRGFQYELLCYVDYGSLICEILIDHNVVQSGIGRSPQEVTAALPSSDKQIVKGMKENMRQFQAFLAHFEVRPRWLNVDSLYCITHKAQITVGLRLCAAFVYKGMTPCKC